MQKRTFYVIAILLVVAGLTYWSGIFQNSSPDPAASGLEKSEVIQITMYRGEACNCCVKWADYLENNGFRVIDRTLNNLFEIKSANHVSSDLASCHTATIDGYAVEGHVPSDEIRRLISERPDAAGIAVPGMPMGSPGMDSFRSEPYEVILFDDSGNQSVFAQY